MSNSLSKLPIMEGSCEAHDSTLYQPIAANPEKEDQMLIDLMQLISSTQEIWSHPDTGDVHH